jgi:FkbM family methyltransferase
MAAGTIVQAVPKLFRHRLARLLYDYDSPRVRGVDVVLPYIDGQKILVNTKDFIGWHIYFHGAYEIATNELLRRYVGPGDCVIEAGANHGSETVLLAHLVGAGGRVYAFEPIPHLASRLIANLALNNRLDRAEVLEVALGDENGSVDFHVPPADHPNQGAASKYHHELASGKLTVRQQRLDDWAHERHLSALRLIKMDVQGAEVDILDGAAHILGTLRPLVLTEAAASCSDLAKLHDRLTSKDYVVRRANDADDDRIITRDSLVSGNWLAVPREVDRSQGAPS